MLLLSLCSHAPFIRKNIKKHQQTKKKGFTKKSVVLNDAFITRTTIYSTQSLKQDIILKYFSVKIFIDLIILNYMYIYSKTEHYKLKYSHTH